VSHEERPLWIAVNGVRRIVLSCSPHDPAALALGHLVAEGWIQSAADLGSLTVVADEPQRTGVAVEMDGAQLEAAEMMVHHLSMHGCGTRHVLDCDPFALTPVDARSLPVDPANLVRSLFDAARDLAPDGGLHTAALSDGADLLHITTDVARHCATDRALGLGLQQQDIAGMGLVTTARVSAAMATKAIRARLGWITSRSIATSLAHEIAAAYGLTLFERAVRAPPS
jgi:FdhD protein